LALHANALLTMYCRSHYLHACRMMHLIVLCSSYICYRLNLLTIDLLIKTWFYAVVCKFTTLILSFEV